MGRVHAATVRLALLLLIVPGCEDPWETQKSLITTCQEWNDWVDSVINDLQIYRDGLAEGPNAQAEQIQNQITVVDAAIQNLPATKYSNAECQSDDPPGDLDKRRNMADLYLNRVTINKVAAAAWCAGAELYGTVLTLAINRLSGESGIPWDAINALLRFYIVQAEAAGQKDVAKKLKEAKKLKDAAEDIEDAVSLAEKIEELTNALEERIEEGPCPNGGR